MKIESEIHQDGSPPVRLGRVTSYGNEFVNGGLESRGPELQPQGLE